MPTNVARVPSSGGRARLDNTGVRTLATRWRCALALTLTAALAPAPRAPADTARPSGAQRVVRSFDFEERPMNPEPVPMHWFRAQHDPPLRIRPGYPSWNRGGFDDRQHTSGEWSVLLPTRGGSSSLRLSSGVIAAIPGADYEIAANVRTDGLAHAHARITARFLDDRRNPIAGAEQRGPLTRTEGEWTRVAFELRGDAPGAAWIQIDLELVQPRHTRGEDADGPDAEPPADGTIEAQRVTLEDVSGGAWFDDLVISQIPRIELAVVGEGNVVMGPATPEFTASIRDLTGERLRGRVVILGLDDEVLASVEFDAPSGQEKFVWRPALSAYGWGRARLEVSNDAGPLSSTTTSFAWTPAMPGAKGKGGASAGLPERERFMLIAEDEPASRLGFVPAYARASGVGAVQLPAWTEGLTRESVGATVRALNELVEGLSSQGTSITLALSRVPLELGRTLKIDAASSPLSALAIERAGAPDAKPGSEGEPVSAPDVAWRAYLSDILSKFGQRVRRWQVGRTGEPLAFWRPTLERDMGLVESSFSRLVPKPTLVAPWAAEHAVDDRLGAHRGVTVTLASESPAETLAAQVERIQSGARAGADATFVIDVPSPDVYGARATAVELTKRAVLAWRGSPSRMAVQSPWEMTEQGVNPGVSLAVWRQVVQRLGGRRVAGELPVASGATCLILDGPAGGALVGWTDWASPEDATVEMFLGNGAVTVVDPFGNEEPAPMAGGLHRVALGEMPVFVEGINVELARFRAGFAVEPASLPSEAALHSAELVVTNPWPVAISGTLRVLEPTKWKIEPRVLGFDIPAGETQRLPIDLSFGVGEESGRKRLVAEAELHADARYPRVRLSAPIEIGASATQLTPSYAFVADSTGQANDVSLTLSVTNNGDESASMRVFALAPGYPRQEATVSSLAPGQSAVRRFLLPGGVRKLMGQRLRVGVVQVGGAERVNKSLLIQ